MPLSSCRTLPMPANSAARIGSGCSSIASTQPREQAARPPPAPGQAAPVGRRRGRRLTAPPAASTALSSTSSPAGEWIDAHDQSDSCAGRPVSASRGLACALGHKACREGFSVLYQAGSQASSPISPSRAATAGYARLMRSSTAPSSSIIDDWGLGTAQRRAASRPATRSSTIATAAARPSCTSQIPVDNGTPSSASRRPHDASFFERVVRRTCVLNSTICVFERLICQGIPLVIWWPDNRPF